MLHLKKAGDEPLKRVTVSSVGAEWFEGTGSGYAVQPGGVTFRHRRHPDLPWSIGGGDICHVVLGNGGTTWRMADASPPDRDGWQQMPVDPHVVAARVAGISHGFLAFDDTGSEWTRDGETFKFRLFPNRFVYSREQNRASAPYFTIELGPDDRGHPRPPRACGRARDGTASRRRGPRLVGYAPRCRSRRHARLLRLARRHAASARADPAGRRARRAGRDAPARPQSFTTIDSETLGARRRRGRQSRAGNDSQHSILELATPARLPQVQAGGRSTAATATALPRVAGAEVAILDELDKVNPVTGELIPSQPDDYLTANHLWNAADRKITLSRSTQRIRRVSDSAARPDSRRRDQARADLRRPVRQDDSGRARPLSPGRIQKRAPARPDRSLELDDCRPSGGIKNQSLHVEIYVPHDLAARRLSRNVDPEFILTPARSSSRAEDRALRLPVSLRVWDFTLPDHLSFLPEMNCYGLPDNELDYYRLAHRHRTVLNRLPYNQNGRMQDGCAPSWDSKQSKLDWSSWDRRFGPLLDGSAFADLPRKNVPIEGFYLPLHENWPSPMEGNYNGDYWADHAFPETYRKAFVAATRQIAEHLQAKQWNETLFQGFLNNKNNFKANGWSRGSSPWLLDEPASFQDYWALRYFARAFHEGINQATRAAEEPRHASAAIGLPRRHLAPAVAARQPRRPARLSRGRQRDANLSPAGLRPQANAR